MIVLAALTVASASQAEGRPNGFDLWGSTKPYGLWFGLFLLKMFTVYSMKYPQMNIDLNLICSY